jgi:hypothetical protein
MWDEISVTGNEITYNEISDNNYGVYVKTSVTGTDISINYNNITGNTSYGVYNEDSEGDSGEDVDATYNWWGDASGPDDDAGIINGSGDKASIYVYCGSYVSALIEDTVTESTTVTTTTTTVTTDTDTVVRTRTSTSTIAEGTVTSLSFSTVTDTQVPDRYPIGSNYRCSVNHKHNHVNSDIDPEPYRTKNRLERDHYIVDSRVAWRRADSNSHTGQETINRFKSG